jgi:hypothetical protein
MFALAITLSIVFIGCSASSTATYTPKYTADKVIYIAQAKYPIAYKGNNLNSTQAPTSITAIYIDAAVWKVNITCPYQYQIGQLNSGISALTLYFYEGDGSFHNNYDNAKKTLW